MRNGLVVFGLAVILLGVKFFNGWIAYACVIVGLVVGAVRAYSGRAALFGLRPFWGLLGEKRSAPTKMTRNEASSAMKSQKVEPE